MKQAIKFKVFVAFTGSNVQQSLEDQLNAWAATLPEGASIKRTQLSPCYDGPMGLFALVDYTVPVSDGGG